MRKHKDFMSEPDYGYIDLEACLEPIFALEEWRSLEDEPEPIRENTSVYVTEPDGIQYFYCGNARIRVSEHFSQAGKPIDKLIEKIVIHEATKGKDGMQDQEIEIYCRFTGKVIHILSDGKPAGCSRISRRCRRLPHSWVLR